MVRVRVKFGSALFYRFPKSLYVIANTPTGAVTRYCIL